MTDDRIAGSNVTNLTGAAKGHSIRHTAQGNRQIATDIEAVPLCGCSAASKGPPNTQHR